MENFAHQHLDAFIKVQLQQYNTPGIAILLASRTGILDIRCYGNAELVQEIPITPSTLFELGSVGKSFISCIFLQLNEEESLDLHTDIRYYLPWVRIGRQNRPVTIHQLLTHTSGIINGSHLGPGSDGVIWMLRKEPDWDIPVGLFHYSNLGYLILGRILEYRLEQKLRNIIETRILERLKMRDSVAQLTHDIQLHLATGYQQIFDDRPYHPSYPLAPASWCEIDGAHACIATTPSDLAAFLCTLLSQGSSSFGTLFSPMAFSSLTQRIVKANGEEYYGYGLYLGMLGGFRYFRHNGGMPGYLTMMLGDIDNGLGVCVFMNGPGNPLHIAKYSLQLLQHSASKTTNIGNVPQWADYLLSEDVAEYAGTYYSNQECLRFSVQNGVLVLSYRNKTASLRPISGGVFYALMPEFSIFPFRFIKIANSIVGVFYGGDVYRRGKRPNQRKPKSIERSWVRYVGHYRSHNPWLSNFRIVLREAKLIFVFPRGDELTLSYIRRGIFRLGELPSDPYYQEYLYFSGQINNRSIRATLSGCEYLRITTP